MAKKSLAQLEEEFDADFNNKIYDAVGEEDQQERYKKVLEIVVNQFNH